MIKGVIPWILRAESALNFIDTSILVFYHQGRQGRTDIRLQPRPAMAGSATSPTKNISRVPPPTITVYPIVQVPHTWIKRGN